MLFSVPDEAPIWWKGVRHPLAKIIMGISYHNNAMLWIVGIDRANVIARIARKNYQTIRMFSFTKSRCAGFGGSWMKNIKRDIWSLLINWADAMIKNNLVTYADQGIMKTV